MSGEDDSDALTDAWTRRQALKGGTFATAGLIGLSTLSRDVEAQQNDPRVRLGDSWVIDDDTNALQIENTDTGAKLEYDPGQGAWVLADPINVGNDIVDGGTTVYDSSTDTVGDGSTSADHSSVRTGGLTINDVLQATKSTQTISSGTIEYSSPFIQVVGESGSNDTLTNITAVGGGEPSDGSIVILRPGGEEITINETGTGTTSFFIDSAGAFTMDDRNDKFAMIYDADAFRWDELWRSDNG